jgi:hypothetical protein
MGVVIDEMEVEVENPPAVRGGEGNAEGPAAQPQGSGLKPEDLRFIIDRRDARAARLFAH